MGNRRTPVPKHLSEHRARYQPVRCPRTPVFGTAPSAPNGGYLRAKIHDSIVCFCGSVAPAAAYVCMAAALSSSVSTHMP